MEKLQYISQGSTSKEQLHAIQSTLDSGCKWIQLRWKNCTEYELGSLAEQVKKCCESNHATFIINDHVHLARDVDADGVHLGLEDMEITVARKILGKEKIIGGTANTWEQVLMRIGENCDYIGVGPFRYTPTKKNLSPILGLEGYQKIMAHQHALPNQTPIYAIGGITLADLDDLMSTGIYGVALSGEITRHREKQALITLINEKLYAGAKDSR